MFKIYLEEHSVWEFFSENKERLKDEQVLIAESDAGFQIYLTEQSGFPQIRVYNSDKCKYQETCIDEKDATAVATWAYNIYLISSGPIAKANKIPVESAKPQKQEEPEKHDEQPDPQTDLEELEALEREELRDEMYEREDELLMAVRDCLTVLLEVDEDQDGTLEELYGDDIVEYFLEHLCQEIVNGKYGSVRRPLFIEEDDGSFIYIEYPYDNEL